MYFCVLGTVKGMIFKMRRLRLIITLIIAVFIFSMSSTALANQVSFSIDESKISEIDTFVKKQLDSSKIPGVSIVVVKDKDVIYEKGFGYSNIKTNEKVTSQTLFELGSTSKAFTALAILRLEKEGLIELKDPVDKYIPWLKFKYNGQVVTVTLEQLINHTTGIPFKSIDAIKPSESEKALEETVKLLVNQELQRLPGERFTYATINYDVLGYVIEKVTGKSYEKYMSEVLSDLGMNTTYLSRNEAKLGHLSEGYKVGFLKPRIYDAPIYRGNIPAGYIISNANDMGTWLKIQLGSYIKSNEYKELIDKSHSIITGVNIDNDEFNYNYGWFISDSKNDVFHGGNNPNFSSFIQLKPKEKLGVAVLSNMNSSFTETIARGVVNILDGRQEEIKTIDMYFQADKILVSVIYGGIMLGLVVLVLIIIALKQYHDGIRKYNMHSTKGWAKILIISAIFLISEILLYKSPQIVFGGITWSTLNVWAPQTIIIAGIELSIIFAELYIYVLIINVFKKEEEKSYFIIGILSLLSGLGNALVIFMINESLNGDSNLNLFMSFLIGIMFYAFGQKIVRTKLIRITNNTVYKLRSHMLNKLLKTSFENFEKIERGKIEAAMNNDTETISNFANVIIVAVTNGITVVCCFIYLGTISFYGLILSIIIIVVIASIYYFVGRKANKQWEDSRDIQNLFFKFIGDLNGGFKELSLNVRKSNDFENDMNDACYNYRIKRDSAAISFANMFVIGEVLFTIAIGAVAFIFPIVFKEIQSESLRSYIFILLYLTGPVNGLLNSIPNIIQMKISFKKIDDIIKEIPSIEENKDYKIVEKVKNLELKNISYEYLNQHGESFKVGPINYNFKSKRIIFITGGNGSGKSTLAKLITGLYAPHSGEILINGKKTSSKVLQKHFSVIFSDFYLFDSLYGIQCKDKEMEIDEYLELFHLKDRVEIKDGKFNTTKLSTGQRKRLALMISFLEDKPIYVFDEWAADQDPEFREIFYTRILPNLKNQGKCIISITHDDRYYDLADEVIKMEFGKVVNESYSTSYEYTAFTIDGID